MVDYGNDCYAMNISADIASFYAYNSGQVFVVTVLLPILLLLGLLGNAAFIFVVYRRPEMRTVTNWYLTNLAVADIVFLLSAIVDKLWAYSGSPIPGDNGPHGHAGCVLLYLAADLTYFASLGFVTLVSFDRFLAVRRPGAGKGRRGRAVVPVRLCAGSWLLGLCFAACLVPSRGEFVRYCLQWPEGDEAYRDWPDDMYICRSRDTWMDAFSNVMQTVPFFLSFALNVFLYVKIVRGLDRSIQNLGSHGMSQDKNTAMRNQIALMLVVNGIVFFFCLFPFELLCLFKVILDLQGIIPYEWQDLLIEISRALAYINSAANPLIYTLMSHRYRANFRTAFSLEQCASGSGPGQRRRGGRKDTTATPNDDFANNSHRAHTATRVETL